MSRFLQALHSGRVLLMDGAMGTELQKAGLRDDENGAAWNLLHPERVRAVHQAYRDAGAEVFLTNTFMIESDTYAATLQRAGHIYEAFTSWRAAYHVLPGNAPYRLAAVGPLFGSSAEREFDPLNKLFVPFLLLGGQNPTLEEEKYPDAVLLETCSSPRTRFAIRRLHLWSDEPILLSMTYLREQTGDLVTLSGHSPEWFASRAKGYGAAALGVNCGRDIGMGDVIEIVRRYRAVTDLPLFARPNAGTPTREGDRWVYPLTPQALAERLPELLEAGVSMVGGCCGTTPEHIAACRPIIDDWNAHRAA